MSATTFFSLLVIYLAGCVLQGAVLMETRTSRACYGYVGLTCTQHRISCNLTQKIAIVDAYFARKGECGSGLSTCQGVNPVNVTVRRHQRRYSSSELTSLYNSCSAERQCVHQPPWGSAGAIFSVVNYRCIDGDSFISFTGGSRRNVSATTIIYKYTDEIPNTQYVCTIQSQTPAEITALDLRLGDWSEPRMCSILTVERTPYICSAVIEPFKQLETIQSPGPSYIALVIKEESRPTVWLRISSPSPFNINCFALPPTVTRRIVTASSVTAGSRMESTSTKAISRIVTASSVTAESRTESTSTKGENTSTPRKEKSTSSRFSVGTFMGGLAAGVVIVVLVGIAVYILVIRRRYDLTPKKQGDTPASVEHPTYSGLLRGDDVNNYASIEQTSGSQEDTTHGPTATPDYLEITL